MLKKMIVLWVILAVLPLGAMASERSDSLVLAIAGEPENGFDPTTGWGRYGSP